MLIPFSRRFPRKLSNQSPAQVPANPPVVIGVVPIDLIQGDEIYFDRITGEILEVWRDGQCIWKQNHEGR